MAAKLKEGSGRLDFGEAAARFNKLAETIKARQLSEAQGSAQTLPAASAPDEVWNSRFGCQGLTTAGRALSANFAPVSHRPEVEPDFSRFHTALARRPGSALHADQAFSAAIVPASAPLSERIGRTDTPKRSWLVRLFRSA